ncbi:hypothetical protein [Nocardia sp. NBC_01009]|uniref:hypothetical protein n=1 Tax=Nocardia sp. NBC_01009 TaxID=2975996 RepID=UPI0038639F0B|nr:hypothetical protein OHA42_17670 [Nocardia sp. NBC_01009]
MLTAGITTTVLVAIVGGAWKWIVDDGPARLVAGLVAALSKDSARRRDARLVLEVTKHQRGPEPGAERASRLPVLKLRGSKRGQHARPVPVEGEAAAA